MPAPRTTRRRTAPRSPAPMPAIGEKHEGGIYAGLTIHDGTPHKLILLPGESENVDWKTATAWAKRKRGVLPSRFDLLVLFENLKAQFKVDWYWSGVQSAGFESYAWFQYFLNGFQFYYLKSSKLRARAVRRVPIQ